MLPQQLMFGTPRKLPAVKDTPGRVVVLDIAFGSGSVFEKVTRPFIDGLGSRLRGWVDHHDHELHAQFARDSRFVLATKAEHGACPEMVTPELVDRIGPTDVIVCHTDFDGLASAAKWMRAGQAPYPQCDADAWAIDTRIGQPSATGQRMDQALRARPRDLGLMGLLVRHMYHGLSDESLWQPIDAARAEWKRVEAQTRTYAEAYRRLPPGVACVEVPAPARTYDKTLLLLLGQEREAVSVVVDRESVAVAARFDSGFNFLQMFSLSGGMPTRVSVPRKRLAEVLGALGVPKSEQP